MRVSNSTNLFDKSDLAVLACRSDERYDHSRCKVLVRTSSISSGIVPCVERVVYPLIQAEAVSCTAKVGSIARTGHAAV